VTTLTKIELNRCKSQSNRERDDVRFEQRDRLRLLVQQRRLIDLIDAEREINQSIIHSKQQTITRSKNAGGGDRCLRAMVGFERGERLRLLVERARQHHDVRRLRAQIRTDHARHHRVCASIEDDDDDKCACMDDLLMHKLCRLSQLHRHHAVVAAPQMNERMNDRLMPRRRRRRG
jgi:hypothetical protein